MSHKVYPDYAKSFKKEFLFLRGIDKEFGHFLKCVFFYDAMTGSFSRKRKSIDRLNKIINKYKRGLDSGVLKDLSKKGMGREVYYNIDYLEEAISVLLERYLIIDDGGNCVVDRERYEDNLDIDYPGLSYMMKTLEHYHEVIKYEKIYEIPEYDKKKFSCCF